MTFEPHAFYHVYNRGINREAVFFNRENYLFFLRKIRKYLCPCCDVVAYCLMPNHFHLLLHTDERVLQTKRAGNVDQSIVSYGIKNLLGSYAKAVNVQQRRTGSLFTQNTPAKRLDGPNYATACFHYIHQNPVRAGLTQKLEDWELSSFKDYAGLRNCLKIG